LIVVVDDNDDDAMQGFLVENSGLLEYTLYGLVKGNRCCKRL
jgi:hypothetical protein